MKLQATIDNNIIDISIDYSSSKAEIMCNNDLIDFDCQKLNKNTYSLILNGKSHILSIYKHQDGYEVNVDQFPNFVNIKNEKQLKLEKLGFNSFKKKQTGKIIAQIPGLVSEFFVSIGDDVNLNDKLFILEAMKMENEITSPLKGVVENILLEPGSTVEKGALIMEIKE